MDNKNTTAVAIPEITNLSVGYQPATASLNDLVLEGQRYPTICTIKGETSDEKIKIMNAITNCDKSLADMIGEEIAMTGFYIEEVENEEVDELSGEIKTRIFPRTIIFSKDGTAYAGGSIGIYNALSNTIRIFGFPTSWDDGVINIKIKQVSKSDTKKVNTFVVTSVGNKK